MFDLSTFFKNSCTKADFKRIFWPKGNGFLSIDKHMQSILNADISHVQISWIDYMINRFHELLLILSYCISFLGNPTDAACSFQIPR